MTKATAVSDWEVPKVTPTERGKAKRSHDAMLKNWDRMKTRRGRIQAYKDALEGHKKTMDWLRKTIRKLEREIDRKR